jgi:integrase
MAASADASSASRSSLVCASAVNRADVEHGRLKGRMLNIPPAKNEEPIHVPSINAAVAALRVAHDRGEGRGRVFHSAKTGEPFENGRDWSDKVLTEAEIRSFRWHDLRHTFTSRLGMKGTVFEDIVDLLEHKSLTMTRRDAHISANKLHAVVSLLEVRGTSKNGALATSQIIAV